MFPTLIVPRGERSQRFLKFATARFFFVLFLTQSRGTFGLLAFEPLLQTTFPITPHAPLHTN